MGIERIGAVKVLGSVWLWTKYQEKTEPVQYYITENTPTLLGLDGIRILDIDLDKCKQTEINLINNIANNNSRIQEIVGQLNKSKGGMNIAPVHLHYEGPPVFMKARNLPYGNKEAVKHTIDQHMREGILVKVQASKHATPIVPVKKSNGAYRICGDYSTSINKHLLQTAFTTPPIEEIIASMDGSKFFSKIDLSNAFLQIPLDEESQKLTVINTPFGLFKYQFLPFGTSVSPGIFQSVINETVKNLNGVKAYQDDLIVHSKTREHHDECLLKLLEQLLKFNVKINAEKSVFGSNQISYLGYRINGMGITPDINKINPVLSAPYPVNQKALESFLGFCQYYQKFIPHFVSIAEPLFNLVNSTM